MDIAIVTGAETLLGQRIIERLTGQGYRVHGIGNNLSNVTFSDPYFTAHAIDLSDLNAVSETITAILEKEKALHLLIHAIDVTPGGNFERLPIGNLEAILKVGLLGPVMLTRLVLPNLLRFRGQLINIIPANKSGHPSSAVNALIEGGLRGMNTSLFDSARDAGLRVSNLILRQNPELNESGSSEVICQTRIDTEHVARVIEQLISSEEPNVPNEIVLYPRLSQNADTALPETSLPLDPYTTVYLPPKEYCPPKKEAISTKNPDIIERTIPYTDEEMEERINAAIEDYELNPDRYKEQPKRGRKERRPSNSEKKSSKEETTENDENNSSKRKRGRRRNKNRNQNREGKPQEGTGTDPENQNTKKVNLESKTQAIVSPSTLREASDPQTSIEKSSQEPDTQKRRPRNRRRGGSTLKPIESVIEKFAPNDERYNTALPKKIQATPTLNKQTKETSTAQPIGEVKQTAKPKAKSRPTTKKSQAVKVPAKKKTAVKKKATKKKAAKKKAAKKVSSAKKTPAKKTVKKAAKKKVSKDS